MNCVRSITVRTLARVFGVNILNRTERERIWFSLVLMWLKHFLLKTP